MRVGGLVRQVRRVVTRSGQIMAYAELEDLTGSLEVTPFPRSYEEYRHLFEVVGGPLHSSCPPDALDWPGRATAHDVGHLQSECGPTQMHLDVGPVAGL